jgi:hypothetical protein
MPLPLPRPGYRARVFLHVFLGFDSEGSGLVWTRVASVRFLDSRVGIGVVMLCQVFRPEERGGIKVELSLDEFPLFLSFREERGQMEKIRKCRGEGDKGDRGGG